MWWCAKISQIVLMAIYIVYMAYLDEEISEGGIRLWSAKLDFGVTKFIIRDKHRLAYFEGEMAEKREKKLDSLY